MKLQLKLMKFIAPELIAYDNGEGGDGGGDGGNPTTPTTPETGGDPSKDPAGSGGGEKTFTQTELEKIVQGERRTFEQKNREMLQKLQALEKTTGMTEQQRDQLKEQIKILEDQTRSKEELEKQAADKRKKEYEERLSKSEEKASFWEKRLKDSEMQNAIMSEVVNEKAINSSIVTQLILPDCQVIEEHEGDEVKGFKVRFIKEVLDNEGKPKTLNFSPEEAIKWFKDQEGNAHLFEDTRRSGYGGGSNVSNGRKLTTNDIKSYDDYKNFKKQENLK